MTNDEQLKAHYGRSTLIEDLAAALREGDQDLDALDPLVLSGFDEFHLGGVLATAALASDLALAADDEVLDVGCGIGGAARLIARLTGCRVTGVDLTAEFVEAATWLSGLVGADRTVFRQANALALPFDDGSFDAVTMLHVGMNIEDKTALFGELARVLRPGGRVAVYDIVRTAEGDLPSPMPWSSELATSHLARPGEYELALDEAGLRIESVVDRRELVTEALEVLRASPQPVNLTHLMGDGSGVMFANLFAAFTAGTVTAMQFLARRGQTGGQAPV